MRILLLAATVLLPLAGLAKTELSDEEIDQLLAKLAARPRRGMVANYIETKNLALLSKPVKETGTLSFLPPDLFKKAVTSPNAAINIYDGSWLWIVLPEDKLAEGYPASRSKHLATAMKALASALNLSGLSNRFRITGHKGKNETVLTLTPKSRQMKRHIKEIIIRLDSSYNLMSFQLTGKNGDHSKIKITSQKSVPLRQKDFSFTPPADFTVSYPVGK